MVNINPQVYKFKSFKSIKQQECKNSFEKNILRKLMANVEKLITFIYFCINSLVTRKKLFTKTNILFKNKKINLVMDNNTL